MSTYQYYEFQAVDRPLTAEEQQAIAKLSSRVDPHPRQAVFVYHWSGFPGNSREILARYYQGEEAAFQQRLNRIYEQYSRRSALLRRLREAGLQQS